MKKYKYPRTFHLPFSPSKTSDDKTLSSTEHFSNKNVSVSLKMDGENTTLYPNYLHARSINEPKHPSQDWIKSFHSQIKYSIPENFRICGENLFAKHSIEYTKLPSFFMAFSVWHKENCLSVEDTKKFLKNLNIEMTPVIYEGIWDEKKILKAFQPYKDTHEGFVVRLSDSFLYSDFKSSVAKYVRENHVQTDVHWSKNWTKNGLR